MPAPADFDTFYQATRARLLLETYALTGDLPAARSAVREAYVSAWHHWRKVSTLPDPESWVRPHAWSSAQRRHQARIWHREKNLDEATIATFEALGDLTPRQRKALLLAELAGLEIAPSARELGLTVDAASTALADARASMAQRLEVAPEQIAHRLTMLGDRLHDTRYPRSTIIRRGGSRRRRTHTLIAVAATAALLLGGGVLVHQNSADVRALGKDSTSTEETGPRLHPNDLLDKTEIAAAVPKRTIATTSTDDNTGGTGRYALCQRDPFADPAGLGTLVRTFTFSGRPTGAAMQAAELSKTPEASKTAYDRLVGWYLGCTETRVQLISTHRLDGVGEEAMVLALRAWERPATTHLVALSRTGSLLTSTTLTERGERGELDVNLKPLVSLIGSAVTKLCANEVGGTCVTTPKLRKVAPPPGDKAKGMLQEIDLPPVTGIDLAWAGTKPTKATNVAATPCTAITFKGKQFGSTRTRSFVIPGADLATYFGITETYGRMASAGPARKQVEQVRAKMASCEDDDLTTEVARTTSRSTKGSDLTIWRIDTELSDKRTLTYWMAIIRRDADVAQVVFVPDGPHTLPKGGFSALGERALERLENLPSR
ncbi:hypothetical protein NODU109028_14920 [Nocardioides dubius]|uniref:DNA-directed RNA polymerase specialized sigma subunit, sigma24 family n=1 Tax=Nocardioides dubius TaxID=317019 RepID=A0ABN1U493_9ACTN